MSRNRAHNGPSKATPSYAGELPWSGERLKDWRDKARAAFIYGPVVLLVGVVPAAFLYNPKQPGTSLMFLAGSWLVAYLVGEVRKAPNRAALIRPLVMLALAAVVGAASMESFAKPVARPATRQSGTLAGVTSVGFLGCVQWFAKGESRGDYKLCTTKPISKGKPKGKRVKGETVKAADR